jgi:hypothetical protein
MPERGEGAGGPEFLEIVQIGLAEDVGGVEAEVALVCES